MRTLLPLALALLLGCPPAGDDDDSAQAQQCGAPYAPFSAANYQNQIVRVDAYEQIVAIRKAAEFSAADFDTIEDLYVNSADLAAKVAGRTDDHSYASNEAAGVALDLLIREAIANGKNDQEIAVQGLIIDKSLQRFFYLSVYHEVMKSQDPSLTAADVEIGWDEAFGYFGIDNEGLTGKGIAATVAKRDQKFGLGLQGEIFNALVDGRCALEEGDLGSLPAIIEDLDLALLRTFALSVVHEMDEYNDNPQIKYTEGLLFWLIIEDYVKHLDSAKHAELSAAMMVEWDQLDAPAVRQGIIDVFGFSL